MDNDDIRRPNRKHIDESVYFVQSTLGFGVFLLKTASDIFTHTRTHARTHAHTQSTTVLRLLKSFTLKLIIFI